MKTITLLALTFFVGLTSAFASSNDDTPNSAKNESAAVKKYCYLKAELRSLGNENTYVYSNVIEVISQDWTILKKAEVLKQFELELDKRYPGIGFELSVENLEGESFIKEQTEDLKKSTEKTVAQSEQLILIKK